MQPHNYSYLYAHVDEGSLEAKLPTIWTDEKQRWEESEKRRRKKIQAREKVGKSRNTCVFPMICGSGGSKSRLAKAAAAELCGQMRDEKLHADVARSTFPSQNVQSTPCSDMFGPLLEVDMSKKWTRLWREAHSQVKMLKALLEVEMSKKCTPLWREAHFRVKIYKTPHVGATFGRWSLVLRGRRRGFCSISKNDGRRGTFEEDLQRCFFPGRRSARDMSIRAVRRSGRWFPEKGCILEHQICRFAKMILHDRCSTSYDLASLFRGSDSTLDRWSGTIAKRIGTRPSALHFHFWRKSRRIASFLMLSSSKIEEVLQNCFVLGGVKFQKWGSLAELLRFGCCQVQNLRKYRRIVSFLMLSSSRIEEISQNCCVFKLTVRQTDRQTNR